ncbi:hypothetical protein DERF_003989 [Dermatophagoides farinae]|uniref:Uncharacterized protein n=1 Tax=Dermatophagoides farinae TaxID=6954 RepID=A0A922IEU5_DERFA|nr:hypothetical protein DERF_003989 [Dermatophagoides farinae]
MAAEYLPAPRVQLRKDSMSFVRRTREKYCWPHGIKNMGSLVTDSSAKYLKEFGLTSDCKLSMRSSRAKCPSFTF